MSGLDWQVLPSGHNYKDEARKIARNELERTGVALDVVHLRRHENVVQAAFIRRGGRARKGTVSLAAVAADMLGANFVAAFELPDGRYALTSCVDEVIVPGMDRVCEPQEAIDKIQELSNSRSSQGELQVYAPDTLWPGGEPIDLEDLLAGVKRRHRLRQRPTFSQSSVRTWAVWAVLAALVISAWLLWDRHQRKLASELAAKQAKELEHLRQQSGQNLHDLSLLRPWTSQPSLETFSQVCTRSISKVPVTLDGWVLLNAQCSAYSTSATYARTEGRTVLGFASTARAWREALNVQFSSDGDLGTIEWPVVMSPGGDEGLDQMDNRTRHFMSWWQSQLVPFEVTSTNSAFAPGYQPPPVSSGQQELRPDWKTARWTIDGVPRNPTQLLEGINPDGLRLQEIELDFDAQGQLKWSLKGEIYGQ
ncbi:type 4b pilus protein PilO2 [Pusillimonas caeni]|uniref:type 4b pilus protein PilO2 n=1 Tax=Pusillimonas caeni TaxID=1348472 RepID=UPI001430EA25|nr:type 4b pilus protein PilO2 [Pusillimonas caeni]